MCTHNTSGRLYSRQFCWWECILYSLICMVKTNKQTNKTLWQSSVGRGYTFGGSVRCYPVCVSAIFFISASLLAMSYCWGCACLTHSQHIVLSTRFVLQVRMCLSHPFSSYRPFYSWRLTGEDVPVSPILIISSFLLVTSSCSCYVCLIQSHHIVVSTRDVLMFMLYLSHPISLYRLLYSWCLNVHVISVSPSLIMSSSLLVMSVLLFMMSLHRPALSAWQPDSSERGSNRHITCNRTHAWT